MNDLKAKIKLSQQVLIIAGIFCAFTAILLLLNFWQMHNNKPLESIALKALVDRLSSEPNNTELKQEIRNLDLLARKAYFTTRWQVKTGSYILLFGLIVFAIALWQNQKLQSKIELPEVPIKDTVSERIISQKWLIIVGGSIMLVALWTSFFSKDQLALYNTDIANVPSIESSKIQQVEVIPITENDTTTTTDVIAASNIPEINETSQTSVITPTIDTIKKDKPSVPGFEELKKQHNSFRGVFGQGISFRKNIPIDWDGASGRNIIWKVPLSKPGFNSPVIWNNKLFITGGDKESRVVYCFDINTGKLFWEKVVSDIPGSPSEMPDVSDDTGLAAPTVTTDGKGVYAIFGTGDLIAFDFNGNRLWARNLGVPDNHYGHSSSLIILDNKLIVQYDTNKSGRLIAINTSDGKSIWDVKRPNKISWASPVIIQIDGKFQIITTSVPFVASHDAQTGTQLWSVDCMMGEVGPSAAFSEGLVFAANEYAELIAIQPGDKPLTLWKNDEYLPEASSPVAHNGLLYLATSYGVIVCYDTKTGQKYWEHEAGPGFYSSPVIVDGKLYVIDLEGKMHIFKDGKEKVIIGEPVLGEKAFATPAFIDGRIYLRGQNNLYCIGTK